MLKIRLQGKKNIIKKFVRMLSRNKQVLVEEISDLQRDEYRDGIYKVFVNIRIGSHKEASEVDESKKRCERFLTGTS